MWNLYETIPRSSSHFVVALGQASGLRDAWCVPAAIIPEAFLNLLIQVRGLVELKVSKDKD